MPKRKATVGSEERANRQQTLFAGAFNIDVRLRAVMSQAIQESGKSRDEIATTMSYLLGRRISVRMLNDWTSPSHENHGIQARYLPALCEALGDDALVETLVEKRTMLRDLVALGRSVIREEKGDRDLHARKEQFLANHPGVI